MLDGVGHGHSLARPRSRWKGWAGPVAGLQLLAKLGRFALRSARWVDMQAPAWLRRGMRGLPGSHRLARYQRTRERWAEEYEAGEWERLSSLEEFGRYSILAGYVRRLGPGLRILDVGCGNGSLMVELQPLDNLYVGCDHVLPALQQAREAAGSRDSLLVADADRPPFAEGSFDVVVCNEILNYLGDVEGTLQRLLPLLAPDGHLLVSLFDAFGRPQPCWDALLKACELLDMMTLTRAETAIDGSRARAQGRPTITWRIALLRPGSQR